jgi:hypothetical protein
MTSCCSFAVWVLVSELHLARRIQHYIAKSSVKITSLVECLVFSESCVEGFFFFVSEYLTIALLGSVTRIHESPWHPAAASVTGAGPCPCASPGILNPSALATTQDCSWMGLHLDPGYAGVDSKQSGDPHPCVTSPVLARDWRSGPGLLLKWFPMTNTVVSKLSAGSWVSSLMRISLSGTQLACVVSTKPAPGTNGLNRPLTERMLLVYHPSQVRIIYVCAPPQQWARFFFRPSVREID